MPTPPRPRDRPAPAAPSLTGCGPGNIGLLTDLYQLTMLQAYLEEGLHAPAVFSLFARRLPPSRNFLLACGLGDALELLESLAFERTWLDRLDALGLVSQRTLRWLEEFRFSGDVHAVAEGTPVFGQEPLLEVEAPLPGRKQVFRVEHGGLNAVSVAGVLLLTEATLNDVPDKPEPAHPAAA